MSVTKAALQGMCPHVLYGRYYLAMTAAGHDCTVPPCLRDNADGELIIAKNERGRKCPLSIANSWQLCA